MREHFDLEPVYALDDVGRIVFCNDAFLALVGHTSEEILGKPSLIFYPPHAAPLLLRTRMEAMLPEGTPGALATTIRRKDGALLPVELRVMSLDSTGALPGHLVCVHRIGL
jgi:PAS domain S-box-containing protein